MRKAPSLLKILLLALLPLGADAAGKCEKLVATGNPEYPPYLWQDPQNPKHLIGANADLLALIGEQLGVKIEVLYTGPWSQALDEVSSGRADLLAGAFLTLSRLESMDYVHPALFNAATVVWVRKGQGLSYQGLRAHIGDIQAHNHFAQQEELSNPAKAFKKLLLGRTDYVLYERYPGEALVGSKGLLDSLEALEPPVSSEGLYLTLSHNSACNEPRLRGQLAQKMTELTAAGLPESLLQRNLERWKAQQLQAAAVPPQEQEKSQ